MLTLIFALFATFGGSFGDEVPKERMTINYRVEKQQIDGKTVYKVSGYRRDGGVVFAPPLYMENPPMEWAVPNLSLFAPLPTTLPYCDTPSPPSRKP